ncbi:phage GP46 family protein [Acinetobacter sp. 102]|uniref:phage GP46 family protein n=1 Tax=Acinetobacter sp. 102 TaxID=3098766 RepID=UPI0030084D09
MGNINLETKDYVLSSLNDAFGDDVVQSVYFRLNMRRRRYWANPDQGSRFYTLRRSKDVPRMLQTVRQYAEEALADLVPERLQSLVVSATQKVKSRIELNIEITRLTGEKQTIPYFVPVGG